MATNSERQQKAMALLHQAVCGKEPEGGYVIDLDGMVQVAWAETVTATESEWVIVNIHVSELKPFTVVEKATVISDCTDFAGSLGLA